MPSKKQKIVKRNKKGAYPVLTRYRVEVCPDELTMQWHDAGLVAGSIQEADAFVIANIPNHMLNRVVVETMQVVRFNYHAPSYLG